jgi:hypothetical protein
MQLIVAYYNVSGGCLSVHYDWRGWRRTGCAAQSVFFIAVKIQCRGWYDVWRRGGSMLCVDNRGIGGYHGCSHLELWL